MIRDYLMMAWNSLSHRKMRSWLTMIGILIGIMAFVAIYSLGQGLNAAVEEQFSTLGNDKLWLQPGTSAFGAASTAAKLTEKDVRTVEGVHGVLETAGMGFKNTRIEYKDEEHFGSVIGYTIEDENPLVDEIYGDKFIEGRGLQRGDSFKAVLGYDYTVENRVFPRRVELFDTIIVDEFAFDVVGFREKLGNSQDDQLVFVTDDAYERVFEERLEDDYKFVIIKTLSGSDPSQVANRVERALRVERNVDEGDEDFFIQTTEELQDSFNTILGIINVVILGIAGISIVVGGVGIMNTMYTAVLERTQEIGVMKAIGARNSDVLMMFLIESGMMGFAGGLVGIALGLGIAKLVEVGGVAATGSPYLKAWWSWELIFFTLLASFLLGAISGIAPAYQASRQKPVESLRYE